MTEKEAIESYKADFLMLFQKKLRVLDNPEKEMAYAIPFEELFSLINSLIPVSLKAIYPTLITPVRFTEIVQLRQLFTWFAVQEGYSRNEVIKKLNQNHSTIRHHLVTVQAMLKTKDTYPSMQSFYHIISNKIDQAYAGILSGDHQPQPYTQPDLPVVLDTRPNAPCTDKRQSGTTDAGTGVGAPKYKRSYSPVYSVFKSNGYAGR